MKSPIWIINSALLLLLFVTLGYLLPKVQLPGIISLRPKTFEGTTEKDHKPLSQAFLKTIYEDNDLFSTYTQAPKREPVVEQLQVVPPPTPPAMRQTTPLPAPVINFMEPLKITLTGILISSSPSDNRVIIADNATKEEKLYKMGDKVADAFILRIFKNKIILLRSNGQQETLFINPAEAQAEIAKLQEGSWQDVISKESDTSYIIDPTSFGMRVQGLPQLIEILDLTTVFSKGRSVGTRIGKMEPQSLGYALGFQPGDIIVDINDTPPTTTANRIAIYNQLLAVELGNKVDIQIVRAGSKITLSYTIASLIQKDTLQPLSPIEENPKIMQKTPTTIIQPENFTEQKIDLLDQKYRMSPAVESMKKHDKQAMKNFGSRKSFLQSVPQ